MGWGLYDAQMRSPRHLPPLLSLRAFEAIGRLGTFRAAAEELLITQSAVSHHIRRLEADLGLRLFEKVGRAAQLTPAGAIYCAEVRRGFAVIEAATARVRVAPQRLKVSVLPSFAANWLVQRLGDFQSKHPDIELELDPTLRLVDVGRGEADVAIRYGDGRWDYPSQLLMAETLMPVVSPTLQEGRPITCLADLAGHTLLATSRSEEWAVWAQRAGVRLPASPTLQLTDYNIALQAALDGRGVALGRLTLIADRLARGELIAPLPALARSDAFSYWIVTSAKAEASTAINAFCLWLSDAAHKGRQMPLTVIQ